MSFILDALRKAEQQRTAAPALRLAAADRRAAPTAPQRLWPATLALLLALNAAALWWLWRADDAARPAAANPTVTGTAESSVTNTAVTDAAVADLPRPPSRATATVTAPSAAPADAAPPTLSLDIHVYSAEPRRRFVLINGSRYQEGDRLTDGPLLQTITADGVMLLDAQQRRIELRVER